MLPRKVNFTQMEKYGKHTEKTYREAFCTVIDWFYANFSLLMQVSKPTDRLANVIGPSYLSKSGKQTPWTGKFWSGCASCAKWGLEILGIAALNIDQHSAFALKAVQTPDRSISMSTFKSLMVNQYLCKRIFSMSGFRPNMRFIKMFNQALVEFQLDAC